MTAKRSKPAKKTETLEVRMSPEEKAELHDAARAEGRTASEIVRRLVRRHLLRRRAFLTVKRRLQETAAMLASPPSAAVAGLTLTAAVAVLFLSAPDTEAQAVELGLDVEIWRADAEVRNVWSMDTTVVTSPGMTRTLRVPLSSEGSEETPSAFLFDVSATVHEEEAEACPARTCLLYTFELFEEDAAGTRTRIATPTLLTRVGETATVMVGEVIEIETEPEGVTPRPGEGWTYTISVNGTLLPESDAPR